MEGIRDREVCQNVDGSLPSERRRTAQEDVHI